MEALNAIGLKPICAIPDQRAKPKKVAPNFPFFKFSNSKNNTINPQNIREGLAKKLHGGLVLLASGLTANIASALTYEEALELSVDSNSATDFDAGSVVETIVNNPILVAGGVALIAVPLVLSQILGGKPKAFGVESAKSAYAKLGEDPNALLLDIRPSKDVRVVGSPDIKGLKKKPVSVVYNGEDKPGFLQKLSLRFKEPENTTLYILDKFDGNSELVAELVTANGFKSAYAIKDGAEGPRGWQNSGLPWIEPPKAFSFDFGGLKEAFGDAADALPVTLGIAAAAGFGVLAFTEIETVLQLLGSAALIQVISKKLLYAEERKQTLKQLDEFLTTKVAPKELVADIKQIGSALLPVTLTSRALPAPTEPATTPEAPAQPVPELPAEVATNNTVLKAEAAPDTPAEPATTPEAPAQPAPELPAEVATNNTVLKAEAAPDTPAEPASESSEEAAPQPPPEIDSVPSTEAKVVSQPRPLSPYAAYPDFKPPSSPCPSQP